MLIDIDEEKIKIVEGSWGDRYKLELLINKNIRELSNKINYMESIDYSTYYKDEKDRLKYAYQKKMADLFISLLIFFDISNDDFDDLLDMRLERMVANDK